MSADVVGVQATSRSILRRLGHIFAVDADIRMIPCSINAGFHFRYVPLAVIMSIA